MSYTTHVQAHMAGTAASTASNAEEWVTSLLDGVEQDRIVAITQSSGFDYQSRLWITTLIVLRDE